MPKRTDVHSILILGSGPIVIGQGCEFDYSGAQACKALRAAGYRVILVNSNPATIMTDPDLADATYVDLTPALVEKIIAAERPDALLPTVGGQTALNLTMDLARAGTLDEYGVQLLGASIATIELAEDRLKFRDAMWRAGLQTPASDRACTVDGAEAIARQLGFPCLIRPHRAVRAGHRSCRRSAARARPGRIARRPPDRAIGGWKEYELGHG
jgi:carbamoyl-phosphate synthase large subunit